MKLILGWIYHGEGEEGGESFSVLTLEALYLPYPVYCLYEKKVGW